MQAPVTISGVRVPFPEGKKPFPQQLAVMQKIIASCTRSEHALLESPTGTGKTLALLCASLAWQQKNAKETGESLAKVMLEYEDGQKRLAQQAQQEAQRKEAAKRKKAEENEMKKSKHFAKGAYDDDDFEDLHERSANIENSINAAEQTFAKTTADEAADQYLRQLEEPVSPKEPFIRIFYSSRTHSQLAQVVAELKRCTPELLAGPDGKGLRMCVLGSRDVYCINPLITADRSVNRNEACKDMLKKKECGCYSGHAKLAVSTATSILDVEELTSIGKKANQCPFFASKMKFKTAHITFLPYTYLIDPSIRRAMDLNLKGAVVIFDEAHNVEDTARDAATIERTLDSMTSITKILKFVGQRNPDLQSSANNLMEMISSLCSWASERPAANADNGLSSVAGVVLEGPQAVASWKSEYDLQIDSETVAFYRQCFARLQNPPEIASGGSGDENFEPQKQREVISPAIVSYLDSLLNVLEFLVADRYRYARDFRIATISKWVTSAESASVESSMLKYVPELAAERSREKRPRKSGTELTLCIWCMNPEVAFRPIREAARSIILTSGTLSPLKAFAAELGCDFKHTLEATHVCDIRNQLFASAFQRVGNELLDATFKNAERLDYLSALGESVLTVAKETPGGVLVFFPSYAMLERCQNRWKATNMWDLMNECKPVACETRGTTQEFERAVTEYRNRCKFENGAMFFAVFRGKLSEGIDFKDEAARAVLIIGIPFPNVRDLVVGLKKAHQDLARARAPKNALTLPLSGQEWYQQQAYRALNQALGRVIRHRHDYGAIILLDHRFGQLNVVENLSKWMRGAVRTISDVREVAAPLREFFQTLQRNPPGSAGFLALGSSQPSTPASQPTSSLFSSQPTYQLSSGTLNFEATPPASASQPAQGSTLKAGTAVTKVVDLKQSDDDGESPARGLHKVPKLPFSPCTDEEDDPDISEVE